MVDLKEILRDLELSVQGTEIKELIIRALSMIKDGGDAQSLNGTSWKDFVTVEEFNEVAPLLDDIVPDSDKGVKSKAICSYINLLKTRINEQLLRNETDMDNPVMLKLKTVSDTLNDIYDAIRTKDDGIINKNDPLSAYSYAIRNMHIASDNPEYESLSVEQNGTWPEDGSDTAYSSVSVNVSNNLTNQKTINQLNADGTFKLSPSNGTNGYKKVNIDIGGQLKTLELSPSNILNDSGSPADLGNETGSVTPNDNGNTLGYKEVTIDIRDKFKDVAVELNDEFIEQTLEAKDGDGIENSEALYGYKTITVNFDTESKTSFDVRFHAKETVTVNVEKHGIAMFPGDEDDIPEISGKRFTGYWNPDPIDVVRDMDCYPEYEPEYETDTPTATGESPESWESIGKNGGVNVKIGEWKWIYADKCDYTYYDKARGKTITIYIPPVAYQVYKVAENYCGATSVWFTSSGIPGTFVWMNNNPVIGSDPDELGEGWKNCDFRKWLNERYLSAIGNLGSRYPYNSCGDLASSMKTMAMPYSAGDLGFAISEDKLWLPSATECGIGSWNEEGCMPLGVTSPVTRTMSGNNVFWTVKSLGYSNINGQQVEKKGLSLQSHSSGWGWEYPAATETQTWDWVLSDALKSMDVGSTFWHNYYIVASGSAYGTGHAAYSAFPQGIPDSMEGTLSGRNPFNMQSYYFSFPRFGFGT